MFLGAGEAVFVGDPSATPDVPSARNYGTKTSVVNGVDGKSLGKGGKSSDGAEERGFEMPKDPRLFLLLGRALVWDGIINGAKATLNVPPPPPGRKYTCVVTQAGMMSLYQENCDVGVERKAELSMSPVLAPGSARFILSWGKQPSDLDIHMLVPGVGGASGCEVSWRNKDCFGEARLDLDNTQGYGPETISLSRMRPGKYIVFVNEYNGNPRAPMWGASSATVTYYSPDIGRSALPLLLPSLRACKLKCHCPVVS